MIIDCERCEVREIACDDCVVGVLLGAPEPRIRGGEVPSGASVIQLDAPECRALDALAAHGMVPRLRLVAGSPRRVTSDPESFLQDRDAG
ncbi:hypothetical protein PA7_10010 [Pseudonocardia asaccharolytica DSM 44247 = NBRC 16224]|uniref:Uncharacterized protein n=1 Tax=Pseudonocardia asaccharolytica DSM 44247 = NBRC 16224 TaxID=1123024 RepID=A0A511D0V4_9PSEU|nr:hypothetical protein [Pseudonocardia asaccharolytica]GEL17164.1 hypothetical protein PA7_10010 [Pseudonocardia asaccharolytica DSM 44247 = NBRC 16224]